MYPVTEESVQPAVDVFAWVALMLALFLGANLLLDRFSGGQPIQVAVPTAAPDAIIAPYPRYTITQGPHGAAYGHLAVDLSAGKGAPIRSPITGVVTARYRDRYGNTTLVIENEYYEITLLHGVYTVVEGEAVEQGQVIGKESNKGYTTDMQGRPCKGRDCGYHTHLNIYDKRLGANVNPLRLLEKSP